MTAPDAPREGGLVAWQWAGYPEFHRDRRNLVVHVLSWPWFLVGTCTVPLALATHWWLAPIGLVAMIGVVAVQGRGHALEVTPPIPFRGPLDVVARIFTEQWINFPRYLLSGGLARAWRAAGK